MASKRVPMQVSPEFVMRMKKLQEKIMRKHGKNISVRELTKKIATTKDFDNLENSIINEKQDLKKQSFTINFDTRFRL